MPIEFSTCLELDLVYTRWSGRVDLATFKATFRAYLNDTHYRPGRTELINFTDVTGVEANFQKIWSILRMVNNQSPGRKVATRTVLVAPSEVIFGLCRIYQTLADNAEGIQVEVYRAEADGLAALDLPYDTIAALLTSEQFLPYTPREIASAPVDPRLDR